MQPIPANNEIHHLMRDGVDVEFRGNKIGRTYGTGVYVCAIS